MGRGAGHGRRGRADARSPATSRPSAFRPSSGAGSADAIRRAAAASYFSDDEAAAARAGRAPRARKRRSRRRQGLPPRCRRSAARAEAHSASMTLAASLPKGGTVNSDIAFWGNLAYQGSYDGFRVIDISKPTAPSVLADVALRRGPGRRHGLEEHPRPLGRLSRHAALVQGAARGRSDGRRPVRGPADLRRVEAAPPPARQARRHRLRLAHEHARPGHGARAGADLRPLVRPAAGAALRRRSRGEPAAREDLDRRACRSRIPRAPRSWALRRSKRRRSTEASSVRRSAATTWASSCRCTSRPSPA